MELKEALETLRPVLMALNVVMLKQDELNALDRQLREAKDLTGKIESMKARLLESQTEQANANAKRVEAERKAEQLVNQAKAQASAMVANAEAEGQRIVDRMVATTSDRMAAMESWIVDKRAELKKLESQIEEDLQRHNEILTSLQALKAKL